MFYPLFNRYGSGQIGRKCVSYMRNSYCLDCSVRMLNLSSLKQNRQHTYIVFNTQMSYYSSMQDTRTVSGILQRQEFLNIRHSMCISAFSTIFFFSISSSSSYHSHHFPIRAAPNCSKVWGQGSGIDAGAPLASKKPR